MLVTAVVLLAVLAAAALAGLVAAVAVVWGPQLVALRRERVIVNLRSGQAITGTITRDRGPRLELASARLHEAGQVQVLDGRAVVEKANVAFVQVLSALDPDAPAS